MNSDRLNNTLSIFFPIYNEIWELLMKLYWLEWILYNAFFLFIFSRYLIDAGANVNAQTSTGDTALTYACENGHTDVADLLLQAGANLVSL